MNIKTDNDILLTSKSSIAVCGYKSFYKEQGIEFRPFTVLSGANSSGKSSIIQPLLLLKQTLESTYDRGTLSLDGQHVFYTSFEQLLSKKTPKGYKNKFSILFTDSAGKTLKVIYKKTEKEIDIDEMIFSDLNTGVQSVFREDMSSDEVIKNLHDKNSERDYDYFSKEAKVKWTVKKNRCFLYYELESEGNINLRKSLRFLSVTHLLEKQILEIIHLPGLRGNPERTYKTTSIGPNFPGPFQHYVASIINHWQSIKDERFDELSKYLEIMGLTWKIEAKQLDDTRVELLVGRLTNSEGKAKDLVNIADVGIGVSQILPVLVSLLIAGEGQIVYIEQPELHLHPRAQVSLAQIIADAARRGVCVVIETHSPLLLLGIQTLVAEKKVSPDLVKLHWFTREKDGYTKINSVDLDEKGAYGDWPEDFGDISLKLESRYLDAAEDWGI